MAVVVDLVIVALIAICAILGYIKGLTKVLIGIIAFALSIVIAFVLFIPVSNFIIQNTQFDEELEKSIREIIISDDEKVESEKLPNAMADYINKKIVETSNNAKQEIADSTAKDLSHTIIKAGSWIALFIVARLILILLKLITSLITKLPVIKQFDKLGGVIYGLLKGLIIVYVTLTIISFVSPMTNGNLVENINNSYIGSIMYNNNLLLNIIF